MQIFLTIAANGKRLCYGGDFVADYFLFNEDMIKNDNSTKSPLLQNRCCHIGFLFIYYFGFASAPLKSETILKLNIMSKKINLTVSDDFYKKIYEIKELLEQAEKINVELSVFGLSLTINRTC